MYVRRFFMFFVLFAFFSHLLNTPQVALADGSDNKSVAEIFRDDKDGQTTVEENEQIDETNIPITEEIAHQEEFMENSSIFGLFLQMFVALAVVIIMIYLLIRFIGRRTQSFGQHRTLQNLGGVNLGTNRSVQIVKVGNRLLVVGVGETIQLLKEIEDEAEIQQISEEHNNQFGDQMPLPAIIKSFKSRVQGNKEQTKQADYFKSLLDKQLTDVKKTQKQIHAAIKENEK